MSIFEKIKTAPTNVKSTEKNPPRKHWINIGIPVILGEKEVFINVPLSLAADDIEDAIERESNKLKGSNSDEFTAVQEGKLLLANAVKEVFKKLDDGEALLASDSENALLQKLRIQFFKVGEKSIPENAAELRKGIFNAMVS